MSDTPTNVVSGANVTDTNMAKTRLFKMFKRTAIEVPESDYMKIRSGKKKGSTWEPHGLDSEVESVVRKVLYKDKKCYVQNVKTGAIVPLSLC